MTGAISELLQEGPLEVKAKDCYDAIMHYGGRDKRDHDRKVLASPECNTDNKDALISAIKHAFANSISSGFMPPFPEEVRYDLILVLKNHYKLQEKCYQSVGDGHSASDMGSAIEWLGTYLVRNAARDYMKEYVALAKEQFGRDVYFIQKDMSCSPAEQKVLNDLLNEMHAAFSEILKERQKAEEHREQAKLEEETNREQAKLEQEKHREQVKLGQAPIRSVEDAATFYQATNGFAIINQPPIKPDGAYYRVAGTLEKKENNGVLIVNSGGSHNPKYFGLRTTPKTVIDGEMRFNGQVLVVGKYDENIEYMTLLGQQKAAPLFDAAYVEAQ